MKEQVNLGEIPIGVIGLGLMGSSIVVSLLLAGHPVIGIAPIKGEEKEASVRIKHLLEHCREEKLFNKPSAVLLSALTISSDYHDLDGCKMVLECVLEEIDIKKTVYKKIVMAVSKKTIIATNTSAIPISILQQYVPHPARFIGIHWAEPAFTTRFMEITCGDKTSGEVARWTYNLAHYWGKEPTLLRKDIRGFITNRLMYAVSRETLSLVEDGVVSMEDADKCFRYNFGSWITIMGIFRRLDFLGLGDYKLIFNTIFSKLNNRKDVPEIMKRMVKIQARGVQSCHGLYSYTDAEAIAWDESFSRFNGEISRIAELYPSEKAGLNVNGEEKGFSNL